jgi:hypothetical protein
MANTLRPKIRHHAHDIRDLATSTAFQFALGHEPARARARERWMSSATLVLRDPWLGVGIVDEPGCNTLKYSRAADSAGAHKLRCLAGSGAGTPGS